MIDIVLSKNQAEREPDAIWVTYSAAASRFLLVKSGRGARECLGAKDVTISRRAGEQ